MAPSPPGSSVVVPINGYSDGDATHRPKVPPFNIIQATIYLEKLAKQWMEDRGEARPGEKYKLDRLPAGYVLAERPRPSGPRLTDKYLFGHPSNKYFDSPNRFYPHFKYLMDYKPGAATCKCSLCNTAPRSTVPTGRRTTTNGKSKEMPKTEGIPDVYAALLEKLEDKGSIDEDIIEDESMDWRAERRILPNLIKAVTSQHSFIPRQAELVLFVGHLEGEIRMDPSTSHYKVFDTEEEVFKGYPGWMAGTVAQVPEEAIVPEDLIRETKKKFAVNRSGFRVECFPNPNGKQKGYSKQYRYIPLHHIRPFNFWQELLVGTPEDDWHPTIKNALTVMASSSLIEKYHMRGVWPNATLFCKGLFLGPEAIYVDDVVRLLPQGGWSNISDALRISSIQFNFTNLDHKSGGVDYRTTLRIVGKAYTVDPRRAFDPTPVTNLPACMEGFTWYGLHRPDKFWEVPYTQILGRFYHIEAMKAWFSRKTINIDLPGVRQGRLFSRLNDSRIPEGRAWLWTNSRVETLDLETLNGLEVGSYDSSRDPVAWRQAIRVLKGVAGKSEQAAAIKATEAPRASLAFPAVNSELVKVAQQESDEENGTESGNETSPTAIEAEDPAAEQLVHELAAGSRSVRQDRDDASSSSGDDGPWGRSAKKRRRSTMGAGEVKVIL
ncbi:hypothetical protein L228DRAFT_283239 [Xylona heveae TC161]|uniref:Cryptic loci regulator 2 N-terminal domain-containing protein n=1 Tax=Xylona heveae (strain CBS 132557 / TC161) TaxID=1328760 RepID=A0A165GD70_XYLHT|nr:hypothetical protein L228DRAFT_283239 [Xylona heveae TC161]KZF22048.1 hypothetical protein L228DRAFT_283239 [Xylona heveae TC161]